MSGITRPLPLTSSLAIPGRPYSTFYKSNPIPKSDTLHPPPLPRAKIQPPAQRTRASQLTHTAIFILAFLPAAARAEVSFNRDIRPIMSDTCFRCHGPDKNARMAGMRLDIREEALKRTQSGITPIVPGDIEHSAILQRVFSSDPARIMPPT